MSLRRTVSSAFALTSVAVLALGLAACAPEGSPSPSQSASRTPSASASAAATPSPSETADAAACVVGTWTMGQPELEAFYGDINGALSGSGVMFTPEGSAALVLGADGAFTWTPDARVTAEVSGTEILITLAGNIDGTYVVAGDRITTDTQSAEGLQVTATIDGAETDPGEITEQIAGAPITDSAYTCAGDTLTLVADIGGAAATTVLHRG